ncbi:MAG: sugar ABC transporter permease [Polyangiaceae bacterium UTPRO1]|nr:sugar ABC transporter permease [Myxococcales bacterium]OQY66103.1 MAG: sugar ABC transporter permease [Polyangiaceae bacterium UTPRO1]
MRRGGRLATAGAAPGLLFAAPALAAIALFFFVPVAAAIALSGTDFDIYAVASRANLRSVGLGNYYRLAGDPLFRTAVRNTLYFVVVAAPLSIAASLGAALLLSASLTRWKPAFRAALFLPVVTTLVAVAVVWRYAFHPRIGLLNALLAPLGIGPIDWLGEPRFAMPAIVIMTVWKNFGFNMVILIAGLQSIPERLYEAARVDGARARARLLHVTLPMLRPTLVFVTVMTLIGDLQLFAEPYVMTQGGPAHATLSVVLLMYLEGFRWWNMGYAAAIAFALFLAMLVPSLVVRAMGARGEVA